MTRKRIRHPRKGFKKNTSNSSESIKIKKKEKIFIKKEELILSITDKIVWAYKINNMFIVKEVITVSYVATIDGVEYTIIYYDNTHDGIMHSHLRRSIKDSSDTPITLRIKKKGNQGDLLHWAIKDIMNNWYYYRKKFYSRSGLKSDF